MTYVLDGAFIAEHANVTFGCPTQGNAVDKFKHAWTCVDDHMHVFDATGAELQVHAYSDFIDALNTYALANQAGTSWGDSPYTGFATDHQGGLSFFEDAGVCYGVICGLKYHPEIGLGRFFIFCAIIAPAIDGSYTIAGCSWGFYSGPTASFLVAAHKVDLAGAKTFADAVVMCGGANDDVAAPFFLVFPPIATQLGAALALNQNFYLWPGTWWAPGDTYHGLGMANTGMASNAGGEQAVFIMPKGADTEILIYISKANMAATAIPFLTGTIEPTYPLGCMLRAALPIAGAYTVTLGFPARTDVNLAAPVAVPGVFVDTDGAPYDAFTDSGFWFDGSAGAGGNAEYFAVPRILVQSGATWLVAWYQPWIEDTSYLGGTDWTVKEKVRLQTYDIASGLFTDAQAVIAGATAPIDSLGGSPGFPTDFMDFTGFAIYLSAADTILIWHYVGPAATGSARNIAWLGSIAHLYVPRRPTKVGIDYFKPPPWA